MSCFPTRRLFLAVLLGVLSQCAHAQDSPTVFPVQKLNAGILVIQAEVASTDPQREQGLMFRPTLGESQGMAFVFDFPARECMWMKNTLLPLSVAFLDETGTIVNIEDMQPQTLTDHCSTRPVLYALEMNLGWFAKHGLKAGSKISGFRPLSH
ncbi:MAG: DUF192 domain-containing protein [Burkholderiaceae bacterium]|jgi:uncharacterized membrane protein (UPF0127 family)